MKKFSRLLLVVLMCFQCVNVVNATTVEEPGVAYEEESEITDVETPESTDTEVPESTDVETPESTDTEVPESTDAEVPANSDAEVPTSVDEEEPRYVEEKDPETTVDEALELAYLKIENKKLDAGQIQNIEVGVGNLPETYQSATLFVKNLANSTVIRVDSKELVEGIFSFDIEHGYQGEGSYLLEKISFADGKELSLEQEETSFTYAVIYNPNSALDRIGPEEVDPEAIVESDIDALTDADEVAAAIDNSNGNVPTRRATPRAAKGITIVLDPGHGAADPGAIGSGLQEKVLNWKISNYTKAYLERYDVTVHLSRGENENPSTEERARRGAEKGASLFVSQHINAGGGNGAEVYVSKNPQYNSEGTKLGRKILDNLKALGLNDRGVKTRLYNGGTVYNKNSNPDYYGVIRHSISRGVPAILIEHAFIDSAQDVAKLKNESILKAMGEADAKALVDYYGLKIKGETPKPPTPPSTAPGILSKAHVAYVGWNNWSSESAPVSGIAGNNLEALNLKLVNVSKDAYIDANVFIENHGWVKYSKIGENTVLGSTGKSRGIKAFNLSLHNLPGYQIMYRVKMKNENWQTWRYNGSSVGKVASHTNIDTVQFKLVKSNAKEPTINVNAHSAGIGWQGYRYAEGVVGTTGQSRQLEALGMELQNVPAGAKVTGSAHMAFLGTRKYSSVTNSNYIGTTGQSRRLEAINLRLEGVPGYHLEYRVHIAYEGWTSWIREGNNAGTFGKSRAIEAAEFRIVKN